MRNALILALALCALAAQAVPQATAERKIPCKTPENAASCYWTHGRLSIYNGNPSLRVWKIGTKHLLGIYGGPSTFPPRTSEDSESPELPPNLENLDGALEGGEIFADFEVCPLRPEHPHQMQPACIESAKNIFVHRFRR
jgi:hypothetical protein